MMTFLATPVQHDDGEYLKDAKGEYVYPSLRDASEKYDMSEEHISRTKNKDLEGFERLKAEVLKGIAENIQ